MTTKATRTMDDDRAFLRELYDENPAISPEDVSTAYTAWREDQPPLETSTPLPANPKAPKEDAEAPGEAADDARDDYWGSYLGPRPADYVPFHRLRKPDITIPERHDLGTEQIEKLVSAYRSKFIEVNGLNHDDYAVGKVTAEFRKAVLAQSRALIETIERGEARRQAEQQEQEERWRADEEQRRGLARQEVEAAKARQRLAWLEAGSSEASFDRHWEQAGEAEYVAAKVAERRALAARPGVNY